MHYTSVLFDLDGTLLDTLGDLTAAMNRTLTRHGLPERTRQQMRTALGNGARRLMELSVPSGTDSALFETLLAEYNADYAAHCRIETAPYPGVAALLRTLPEREFRAGLAEVVKAAIIADADLFGRIERTTFEALRTDTDLLSDAVSAAIRVKSDIVERDERESGDRRKLNLGHTLAHAIEKASNRMNHGEAVAVGTALIAGAAVKLGALTQADCDRIVNVLTALGFDLTPPVEVKRLLKEVGKDKKNEDGMLRIVLPVGIGDCEVRPMTMDAFAALF